MVLRFVIEIKNTLHPAVRSKIWSKLISYDIISLQAVRDTPIARITGCCVSLLRI